MASERCCDEKADRAADRAAAFLDILAARRGRGSWRADDGLDRFHRASGALNAISLGIDRERRVLRGGTGGGGALFRKLALSSDPRGAVEMGMDDSRIRAVGADVRR